jgi:tetratricopeptide (TPR) repeat protein
LGYIYRVQDQSHEAIHLYQKALPLWRATKIEIEQANTLNHRAFALAFVGSFDVALQQAQDGLRLRERLGPRIPVGLSLTTLAEIYLRRGELDQALREANRALELFTILDSPRGRGLALRTLAEVKRRTAYERTYLQQHKSAELLDEAITDASKAEQIFSGEIKEPARVIDALLERGQIYRIWARLRRESPHILARTEKTNAPYTVEELAAQSQQAFEEAENLAEKRGLNYKQITALYGLARLYQFSHLYIGAPNFSQAEVSLKNGLLAQIEELIDLPYRITPSDELLTAPPRPDWFLVQLGELERLKGQIAFNRWRGNQTLGDLQEAVEHYTLALSYYVLFSKKEFRELHHGLGHIYRRFTTLNVAELVVVYDTVTEVEKKYGLDFSPMREFLEDRFGPAEHFVTVEL